MQTVWQCSVRAYEEKRINDLKLVHRHFIMAGSSSSLVYSNAQMYVCCMWKRNKHMNSDRFLLLQPFLHFHIRVTIIKTENYEQKQISRAKSTWPAARIARKNGCVQADHTFAAPTLRKFFIFISEILWYFTISFYCFIHNSYSVVMQTLASFYLRV